MLGGARFHPFYPHSDLRAQPCNGFAAGRIGIADAKSLERTGGYGHVLVGFDLPRARLVLNLSVLLCPAEISR